MAMLSHSPSYHAMVIILNDFRQGLGCQDLDQAIAQLGFAGSWEFGFANCGIGERKQECSCQRGTTRWQDLKMARPKSAIAQSRTGRAIKSVSAFFLNALTQD